ncbi:MAG: M15 family metallopeptidase [Candidatus Saccharimonadales bacterium]
MRREQTPQASTSWTTLVLFTIILAVIGWYVVFTSRGIDLSIEESQKMDESSLTASTMSVDLGAGKPVYLPTLSQLAPNNSWMYVSKNTPLSAEYKPEKLQDITLPRADKDIAMKLRADVQANLKTLFDAAKGDEYDLMVSSAYRSISDQQKLLDNTIRTNGEIFASSYVLAPGASEHHTGYALDVTDASTACTLDSDDCILSPSTAAWIADNAHIFGFIVRYPSGKEAITGISHEPWHLRYVGVVLATQLYETDATFDEFIEVVAPGRVSR